MRTTSSSCGFCGCCCASELTENGIRTRSVNIIRAFKGASNTCICQAYLIGRQSKRRARVKDGCKESQRITEFQWIKKTIKPQEYARRNSRTGELFCACCNAR